MEPQSAFSVAVSEYLATQPWAVRRKDTIVAVAGGVAQLAQIATVLAVGAPEWVSLVIGAVIVLAQAVVHAFTPGAITPSMAPRLEAAYVETAPAQFSDDALRDSAAYDESARSYGRHAA
ncbi:hypothetical protein CFAL_12110 (plasmid) [Corynebacterium falsenii DSM 44353]|uniref:hypothetical protein n=1 Tax=Corynebacterium falsenii TaxID=108486 RepID=UPI0003E93627|nr:hypothetical protein [Corynebacterium falsenii]AHI03829.1 hypothetical protein CFAL_09610 [Corynebacterium falsenii DSM 44353]AHI04499.1 hypothetical protein CFAL_12110 [Corynebacterium falsenii DSM 44353]UBI04567.1 hypothetical protein LA343_11450 [Corynebacterium falsenii]